MSRRIIERVPDTASRLCEKRDGGVVCAEPFARFYFNGWRCSYHAPREADVRAAAVARARHRGALAGGAR